MKSKQNKREECVRLDLFERVLQRRNNPKE